MTWGECVGGFHVLVTYGHRKKLEHEQVNNGAEVFLVIDNKDRGEEEKDLKEEEPFRLG